MANHGETGETMMRIARWTAVLALALVVAGCGDDDDTGAADTTDSTEAAPEAVGGSFVGAVEGTHAYIAVVTDPDGDAVAYVCDGDEGAAATVAAFLEGTVTDGQLDLAPAQDVEVTGTVDGDQAEGTVTIAGEEHAFTAAAAEVPAGLYRAAESVDGDEVTAGWVIAADGTQRGALRRAGQLQPVGYIDPGTNLAVPVPGIGTLTPGYIDPISDI